MCLLEENEHNGSQQGGRHDPYRRQFGKHPDDFGIPFLAPVLVWEKLSCQVRFLCQITLAPWPFASMGSLVLNKAIIFTVRRNVPFLIVQIPGCTPSYLTA